jgi:hypothetical protein
LPEANLRLGFKTSQTTNLESRRSQGQTGTIGLICSARAKTVYRRGANRYFIFIKHSFSPVIKHCGSNLKKILPTQPLGLNRISNGFERAAGCAVIARLAVFNVMR